MRRRIEISAFERERIVSQGILTHCPACRSQSELLTLAQAAALVQVDMGILDHWQADGRLHTATTPDGTHRICRNSLLRFSQNEINSSIE